MKRIALCVLLVAGAAVAIANIAVGFVAPQAPEWSALPQAKLPNKSETEQAKIESGSDTLANKAALNIDYVKREFTKTEPGTGDNHIPKHVVDTSIKDRLVLVFYMYDRQNPEKSVATIYEKSAGSGGSNGPNGAMPGMTPSFTKPSFNPRGSSRPSSGNGQPSANGSKPQKYLIDDDNRMIGNDWIVSEFREDGLLIKQVNGKESFLLPRVKPVGNEGEGNP